MPDYTTPWWYDLLYPSNYGGFYSGMNGGDSNVSSTFTGGDQTVPTYSITHYGQSDPGTQPIPQPPPSDPLGGWNWNWAPPTSIGPTGPSYPGPPSETAPGATTVSPPPGGYPTPPATEPAMPNPYTSDPMEQPMPPWTEPVEEDPPLVMDTSGMPPYDPTHLGAILTGGGLGAGLAGAIASTTGKGTVDAKPTPIGVQQDWSPQLDPSNPPAEIYPTPVFTIDATAPPFQQPGTQWNDWSPYVDPVPSELNPVLDPVPVTTSPGIPEGGPWGPVPCRSRRTGRPGLPRSHRRGRCPPRSGPGGSAAPRCSRGAAWCPRRCRRGPAA